jgi:predicted flap endonuclease-1-like 5' DNA nuclease
MLPLRSAAATDRRGGRDVTLAPAPNRSHLPAPSELSMSAKKRGGVRVPIPEAVSARLLNRGAQPVVVRALTVAPLAAKRARSPALRSRARPAAAEYDLSSVTTSVSEPSAVGTPVSETPSEVGPTRGSPGEAEPPPAILPITQVTGVTAPIATQLAAAGLDTLALLAAAKSSEIAAALVGEKPNTARLISQNARRLLKAVTSRTGLGH